MHKTGTGSYFIAIFLVFILRPFPVSAQVEMPDSVIMDRVQLIQTMLDRGKSGADRWWYGWLIGYSAATVGQGIVAIASGDRPTRQDMLLGAGTTLLGAAGQIFTPNTPGQVAGRLRQIPEDTRDARLQKLRKAEELLKESALREKTGRSWKIHAITCAVDLTSGFITWLGFNRDIWAGVGNFALNTVIAESQIWTQPTRAMKDYKEYCRKYKTGEYPVSREPGISWFVNAYPGGIKLRIVF